MTWDQQGERAAGAWRISEGKKGKPAGELEKEKHERRASWLGLASHAQTNVDERWRDRHTVRWDCATSAATAHGRQAIYVLASSFRPGETARIHTTANFQKKKHLHSPQRSTVHGHPQYTVTLFAITGRTIYLCITILPSMWSQNQMIQRLYNCDHQIQMCCMIDCYYVAPRDPRAAGEPAQQQLWQVRNFLSRYL
jgi:hypothetical protein